jgi:site-specific DNA-adenine methylase
MKPFFTYYGGKWRAAPRYPAPICDTIIEPFAGAAGYSVRHHQKKVILIEKNPKMAAVWRYLIKSTAEEIMSLPLISEGQSVDDLNVCQEAKWFIGLNCNKGAATPCKKLSKWFKDKPNQFWGDAWRLRVAHGVTLIKHWTLIEGDYSNAPQIKATWFIDPPYNNKAGSHYPTQVTDYSALANWCKSRQGQVMVCENEGADWLPFEPFLAIKANNSKNGGKISMESLWTNNFETNFCLS